MKNYFPYFDAKTPREALKYIFSQVTLPVHWPQNIFEVVHIWILISRRIREDS